MLSTRTKLVYGIGQISEAIVSRGFDLFLFFYFQQVLGLSASLAGAAVAIALIAEALLAPVAGWLSDRHHSRLGRRHPFLYAAPLPLGCCWWLLFSPPAALGQQGRRIHLESFEREKAGD